jgi:hypothetical protein
MTPVIAREWQSEVLDLQVTISFSFPMALSERLADNAALNVVFGERS